MGKNIAYFTEKELSLFFNGLKQEIVENDNVYSRKRAIRNYALFATMYYCGLRVSEVCMMKTKAYDKRNKKIYCERINGSISNSLEIQPNYEFVQKALENHIKENQPSEYMFTNMKSDEAALSRKTVDVIFKRICHKVGLNKVNMNSYVLRHSMAMSLVRKGLNILELKYWLGHSNLLSTQIYFDNLTNNTNTNQMYQKVQTKK